jgi:hypothetical protein
MLLPVGIAQNNVEREYPVCKVHIIEVVRLFGLLLSLDAVQVVLRSGLLEFNLRVELPVELCSVLLQSRMTFIDNCFAACVSEVMGKLFDLIELK